MFELYNCKDLIKKIGTGKVFRVEVHLRQKYTTSKRGMIEKTSIVWKNKKGILPEIEVEMTREPFNRCDLFVYLMADEERVGFIRLNTQEYHAKEAERPTWRSVISMESTQVIGQLLIALRFHP